jgi:hypothetical protein
MDIENLTKGQIILLTLLVSFVTSIATGIVTVSLVQQAPPALTQTVNRIVERTVERVVENTTDATGKAVQTEKTIVIKEADLIAGSVKAATPSVVAIYERAPTVVQSASESQSAEPIAAEAQVAATAQSANVSESVPDIFVSRGIYVDQSTVVTDATVIDPKKKYSIVSLSTGSTLESLEIRIEDGIAYITVESGSGSAVKSIGNSSSIQLGQTLVVLGGERRVRVATGIISDLQRNEDSTLNQFSIADMKTEAGSPAISLDGELIGIFAGGSWVPANKIINHTP